MNKCPFLTKVEVKSIFRVIGRVIIRVIRTAIWKESEEILGYVVSHGKIRPDPEKKKVICEAHRPNTVKGMRSFLGTANIFRDFLPEITH